MKTDNEIIAEFMGAIPTGNSYLNSDGTIHYQYLLDGHGQIYPTAYAYHAKWDWLMPVVEKIERLSDVRVVIKKSRCRILVGKKVFSCHTISKINSMYSVVVEFIEWLNEEQRKTPPLESQDATPTEHGK